MPLLDHFHPPLSERRGWESFHSDWAGNLAAQLNTVLPPNYVAQSERHHGRRLEVDVATLTDREADPVELPFGTPQTIDFDAVAATAPGGPLTFPVALPPEFIVRIEAFATGPRLVGAIELASPSNKDRPAERLAFAAKCASYLHAGIGLVTIDLVTEHRFSPPADLLRLLGQPEGDAPILSVAAYRPRGVAPDGVADRLLWPLTLGQPLPTVPMWLHGPTGDPFSVPVELEATYLETCRRNRIAA